MDKEKYRNRAKELRASTAVHHNCAQSVLLPFAEDFGLTEEQALRIAANFGSGMKMGAVCGAVTGGLMALGLAGREDPETVGAFLKAVKDNHEGLLDCRDLLRVNHERGGEKKPHCDAMVYECVGLVCDLLDG